MPNLDRLPTAEDGIAGILDLADKFGPKAVFEFIGYIRDHRPEAPQVGQARQMLAAQLFRDLREADPTLDYDEARRTLAAQLGYNELTRTNLYKQIIAGEKLLSAGAGR